MGLYLPPELEWLGWVAGTEWPEGDETVIREVSAAWQEAAEQLRAVIPDIEAVKDMAIQAYSSGSGSDSIGSMFDGVLTGDNSVESLAGYMDQISDAAFDMATQVEAAKLTVIISLVALAIEIAWAWMFPPTAPAVEAAATASTQAIVRTMARFLQDKIVHKVLQVFGNKFADLASGWVAKIVEGMLISGGIDLGVQLGQMAGGTRHDFDGTQFGAAVAGGAAGGAFAKGAGDFLGKQSGKFLGDRMSNPWLRTGHGMMIGAGGGVFGNVGYSLGSSAVTGDWAETFGSGAGWVGGAAHGAVGGGIRGFRGGFEGLGTKHFETAFMSPDAHGFRGGNGETAGNPRSTDADGLGGHESTSGSSPGDRGAPRDGGSEFGGDSGERGGAGDRGGAQTIPAGFTSSGNNSGAENSPVLRSESPAPGNSPGGENIIPVGGGSSDGQRPTDLDGSAEGGQTTATSSTVDGHGRTPAGASDLGGGPEPAHLGNDRTSAPAAEFGESGNHAPGAVNTAGGGSNQTPSAVGDSGSEGSRTAGPGGTVAGTDNRASPLADDTGGRPGSGVAGGHGGQPAASHGGYGDGNAPRPAAATAGTAQGAASPVPGRSEPVSPLSRAGSIGSFRSVSSISSIESVGGTAATNLPGRGGYAPVGPELGDGGSGSRSPLSATSTGQAPNDRSTPPTAARSQPPGASDGSAPRPVEPGADGVSREGSGGPPSGRAPRWTRNPDGTLTVRFDDGTEVQVQDGFLFVGSPGGRDGGASPPHTVRPDGSVRLAGPNESTTTVRPNGEVEQRGPTGDTTTYAPDGTAVTSGPGRPTVVTTPDGTVHTVPTDRQSWTDHGDNGFTVVSQDGTHHTVDSDGNIVVRRPGEPHGIMISAADHTVAFVDAEHHAVGEAAGASGRPGRFEGQTFGRPDRTSHTIAADGSVTTRGPDGSTTTVKPDGTAHFRSPAGETTTHDSTGTTIESGPGRPTVVTHPDGDRHTVATDRGSWNRNPEGQILASSPDGTLHLVDSDGATMRVGRGLDDPQRMTIDNQEHTVELFDRDGGSVTVAVDPKGAVRATGPDGSRTTVRPHGAAEFVSEGGDKSGFGSSGRHSGPRTSRHDNAATWTRSGDDVHITAPDGTHFVVGADKRIHLSRPDDPNRMITVNPDRSLDIGRPDWTSHTVTPDGSVRTQAPDGNVTIVKPDGTTQFTEPGGDTTLSKQNGTVVQHGSDKPLVVSGADGTRQTLRPDGSVTVTEPDGTRHVIGDAAHPLGGRETTFPDGSRATVHKTPTESGLRERLGGLRERIATPRRPSQVTLGRPDGTELTVDNKKGTIRVVDPDGTTYEKDSKGVVRVSAPGRTDGTKTDAPIGSRNGTIELSHGPTVENTRGGFTIFHSDSVSEIGPNGAKFTDLDGISREIRPDGMVGVGRPDGTIRETRSDGAVRVTDPHGTSSGSRPDGTTWTVDGEGKVHVNDPDGTQRPPADRDSPHLRGSDLTPISPRGRFVPYPDPPPPMAYTAPIPPTADQWMTPESTDQTVPDPPPAPPPPPDWSPPPDWPPPPGSTPPPGNDTPPPSQWPPPWSSDWDTYSPTPSPASDTPDASDDAGPVPPEQVARDMAERMAHQAPRPPDLPSDLEGSHRSPDPSNLLSNLGGPEGHPELSDLLSSLNALSGRNGLSGLDDLSGRSGLANMLDPALATASPALRSLMSALNRPNALESLSPEGLSNNPGRGSSGDQATPDTSPDSATTPGSGAPDSSETTGGGSTPQDGSGSGAGASNSTQALGPGDTASDSSDSDPQTRPGAPATDRHGPDSSVPGAAQDGPGTDSRDPGSRSAPDSRSDESPTRGTTSETPHPNSPGSPSSAGSGGAPGSSGTSGGRPSGDASEEANRAKRKDRKSNDRKSRKPPKVVLVPAPDEQDPRGDSEAPDTPHTHAGAYSHDGPQARHGPAIDVDVDIAFTLGDSGHIRAESRDAPDSSTPTTRADRGDPPGG